MIIKLTEEELKNLKIIHVEPRQLSTEYIKTRDHNWDNLVTEGKKAGKDFWNGTLYTFEKLDQTEMNNPNLYLGEMEYKDRLFKMKLGAEKIVSMYGEDHLQVHCGVSVNIITSDKKFVIGKKKASVRLVKSIYAHVSGNLNKDEIEVSNYSDLLNSIIKEIQEETAIVVDKSLLKFNQLNIFYSYFNFDFIYSLPIHSSQISQIYKDDEFESFEAVGIEEIESMQGTFDFEFSKRYLKNLI